MQQEWERARHIYMHRITPIQCLVWQSSLPSYTLQGDRETDRLWFDDVYYMDIVLISLDPKHLVEQKNKEKGKKKT